MNTQRIAVAAALVALAIGTNYALMPIYNVKLMDIIVFVGGFCFGPLVGGLIGVLSWVVYGTLNPMGFSINIWIATMVSESFFGVVGGLTAKSSKATLLNLKKPQAEIWVSFALLGALLTLTYDAATNIAWGYTYGPDVVTALVMGIPFSVVHTVSNAFFFGLGCVPAINAVSQVVGVDKLGILNK